MNKPSQEEFSAYVEVQMSGMTNMFMVEEVIRLAYELCDVVLTKDICLYIMEHYSELKKEYS